MRQHKCKIQQPRKTKKAGQKRILKAPLQNPKKLTNDANTAANEVELKMAIKHEWSANEDEMLVTAYVDRKMSSTQIGKLFNMHPSTTLNRLHTLGVYVRNQSEQKKLYPNPKLRHTTPHSEESKKKMSETLLQHHKEGKIKIWNKGKKGVYSKETLELMSQIQQKQYGSGEKTPWNKGKKNVFSEETIRKMRSRKIPLDKLAILRSRGFGFKKGIVPWNKGKKNVYSEETRKRISESLKRAYSSGKIKSSNIGKKSPIEHIEKLRLSHLGKKLSDEHKRKLSIAGKGKKHPKNAEYMQRLVREGKYVSPMKNPEIVKKMLHTLYKSPNKSELRLNKILNKVCPSEFKYVGNGDFVIGGRCPDYLNVNGRKMVIELFGEPFHDPNYKYPFKNKKMDVSRTYEATMAHYSKYGFSTLIIWHKELADEANVCNKIKTFMEVN